MLLPCRALMNLLEYIVKYKRFKIVSVLCYVCVQAKATFCAIRMDNNL